MDHSENFPPVPLTIEGSSILHQMLRVRWREWRALTQSRRDEIVGQASGIAGLLESDGSGLFSLLGHKGDLMMVHFRKCFDEIGEVERSLTRLALWDYLEQTTSYLSVVELGLYESTADK